MRVLVVLACALFVQSTSEFMLSGLIPQVAADVGVPVPTAGWCTSAFAAGMVVGAPATALWARRWPPRTTLTGCLLLFALVHVVGALTSTFAVLVGARVLAALANAGFASVALRTAARSVPPERTARATGVLLSGTTVALIVGVPAGAALAEWFGWRATFWAVSGAAVVALGAVLVLRLPGVVDDASPSSIVHEMRVLRRPVVVLTLLVAVAVNAGIFAVYTYIGPLLGASAGVKGREREKGRRGGKQ